MATVQQQRATEEKLGAYLGYAARYPGAQAIGACERHIAKEARELALDTNAVGFCIVLTETEHCSECQWN